MNLLTRLDRDRVVREFVARYVADYDRPGILGGPLRDREFAETIGREAVLASVHEVRRKIPGFFGKRRAKTLTEDEREAIKAFLRELVRALERAWHWTAEDRRHFLRDLGMYAQPGQRPSKGPQRGRPGLRTAGNSRGRVPAPPREPPFVGRVALLLDPSMLDQARKAARKFHGEVEEFAQTVLRETLRPSR